MSRLPIPGGDDGKWGEVLNDFLDVAHNSDGSIKVSSLPAPQVADGSITPPKLSQAYVPVTDKGAANGVAALDGSGTVPLAQLPATADATSTTKGIITLTGDLGGSAAAPTVPGLATKYSKPVSGIPETDLSSGVQTKLNASASSPDASSSTKGLVQLTGDLGGTATAPTVPGLTTKASSSTTITAGTGLTGGGDLSANRTLQVAYGTTSGTAAQGNDARISGAEQTSNKGAANGYAGLDSGGKVPVGQLPASTTPDASSSVKGIVQLAGDLAGTAAAPTVPGLAAKATLKGDWSSSTTYAVGDMVRYKAALYASQAVQSNSTPGISSPGGTVLNRTMNSGGSLGGDLDSYPPGTPASDWIAVWAPLKPTTSILVNSMTLKLLTFQGNGVTDTVQLFSAYGSTTPLATGTATTPVTGNLYVFTLDSSVTLSANTIYWIRAPRYRTGTTVSFMATSDTALISNMTTVGEASIVDDIRYERPAGSGYATMDATAGGAVSIQVQLNGPAISSQWTKVESAPDVFDLTSASLVTKTVQGIAPDATGDVKGVVTKVNGLSPDASGSVSFPVVSKLNNTTVGASGNINAVTQINGVAATDANGGNVTIVASADGHVHPFLIDGRLYPSVFTRDVGTSIQVPDEGDHTIVLSNNTTLSIRIPSAAYNGNLPTGDAKRGQAIISGGVTTNPFGLSSYEYNDRDLRHFCTIILQQDEIGGRTVSWTRTPSTGAGSTPPSLIDAPITGPTTIPAPSIGANTVSVYRFEWLGTYLGWVYADSVQGLVLPSIATPLAVAGNPWVRGITLGDGTSSGSVATMLGDIQKIPVNLLMRMHQYGMTWEVGSSNPGLTEKLLGGNSNNVTRSKVSGSVRRLAAWVAGNTRSSPVTPVVHEYGHVVDFAFAYSVAPFTGIRDQGNTKYIFNLHDDPQIVAMNSTAAGQSWAGRQDYFVINSTGPDGSPSNGLNEWTAQMLGTWLYKKGGGSADTTTINAEYAKASPSATITQFETWATAMLGSYL